MCAGHVTGLMAGDKFWGKGQQDVETFPFPGPAMKNLEKGGEGGG